MQQIGHADSGWYLMDGLGRYRIEFSDLCHMRRFLMKSPFVEHSYELDENVSWKRANFIMLAPVEYDNGNI